MKKIALSALVLAASGAYVWSQAGTPDPLLASAELTTGSIQPQTLAASASTELAPRAAPFVTQDTAAAPAADPAPSTQPLPPLPAPASPSAASPSSTPASASPADFAPPAPTGPVAVASADAPAAPPAPAQPQAVATTVPLPRLRPPYRQAAAAAPTPAPASAQSSSDVSTSPLIRLAAATSSLRDGTYSGPVVDAYYGYMQIEAVIQNGHLATIHVLRYPNDRRTSIYINRQALPMLRDEVIQAQSANVNIISGATLSSHAFIQSLGAALDRAHA